MSDSINFNGTDLGGTTYGLVVKNANLPPIPNPKMDVQGIPYGGGISQGQWYEPAVIVIQAEVVGTSMSNVQSRLSLIAAILNVTADKVIYFDCWPGVQWRGRRSGASQPVWTGPNSCEVTWEITIPDPTAESRMEYTESDNAAAASPFTFYVPDGATEVIGGNYDSRPTFVVTGTGAGVTSVVLTNETTSETLTYDAALANTHKLRINSAQYSVEKSTDGGTTYSSVISSVTAASDFPTLESGSRNEFTLTTVSGNVTIVTTYRERTLGG